MNNIQSAFQPLLTLDYIVKQPENKLFDRKSSKVKPGDLAVSFTLKIQRKLCCKVSMAISSVRKMDKYFYASEVKSNA